jgi:hypothetical protein
MIADLAGAARIFGNRGYRYVYFEAGAIGQRLYMGAESLGWNATGIGAFYDDDVHRYLGFLEESETSMDKTMLAAEQSAPVMLNSPASRFPRAQKTEALETAPVISESGEEYLNNSAEGPKSGSRESTDLNENAVNRSDSRTLPRQVIYHFAVGRAIRDPRIEA